jgi:hypothetical protein
MSTVPYMGPSNWPQLGRGSVYSIPTAIIAGMYPQCNAVCRGRGKQQGTLNADGPPAGEA